MINVEVQKHSSENTTSLMRRFSRRIQSSGIVKRVRRIRYHSRNTSAAHNKKQALKRMKGRERYTELVKLGRITPTSRRGGGR